MTRFLRVPRGLLLVAAMLCGASCGDSASDGPDSGSGIEGTYALDTEHLAKQRLAQEITVLKADSSPRTVPDGRTVWQSWNEAQRREAVRIIEAGVRWAIIDGRTDELRLEAAGRFTYIRRERVAFSVPLPDPISESFDPNN